GHPPLALSRQQAALLKRYDWPGNIRELKNVIERAVILSRGKVLRLDLAMADILTATQVAKTVSQDDDDRVLTEDELRELERRNMLRALELCGWRVSGPEGAAKLLGLRPSTFADRMRKYGIARPTSMGPERSSAA